MAIAKPSFQRRSYSTSLSPTPKKTPVMAKEGGKRPRGEKLRATGLHQHSGQFAFSIPYCNLLPPVSGHPVRKNLLRRRNRKPRPRRQFYRIFSVHEPSSHQPLNSHLPTNDMPNDLGLGRGANKKIVYKHPALIDIINKVEPEEKDRDRLHGLVTCAEEFKQTQNRSCKCIDIQLLGWFGFSFTSSPYPLMLHSTALLRVFIGYSNDSTHPHALLHLLLRPQAVHYYKLSLAPPDVIKGCMVNSRSHIHYACVVSAAI